MSPRGNAATSAGLISAAEPGVWTVATSGRNAATPTGRHCSTNSSAARTLSPSIGELYGWVSDSAGQPS